MVKKLIGFLILSASVVFLQAQSYHSLQGSSYAGSIGVHNNPSSIVNTPYKWDLTLLGVQAKFSTNFLEVRNYSLLSPAAKSEYIFNAGSFKRYVITNATINLLNARIALNRQKVIAFGANLRNYAFIKTSDYNFYDTLKKVGDFFSLNERNQPLTLDFVNSGWIELYASYAQTIFDNEFVRLNAGATLKLSRGISGAHASLQGGKFERIPAGDPPGYSITGADARFGYSSNYDRWSNSNSQAANIQNFLKFTEGGASVDVGAELLIKSQAVPGYDEENYFDYDWKLGLSILDLGINQYKYGLQSRSISGVRAGITNIDINQKFDSTINSIKRFDDSLATIVNQNTSLSGKFRIINPTRMVLNVDRYLAGNFYVNGELSINLSAVFGKKWLYVKEMNLVTITPRWETKRLGFYMPVTYNTQKQFWIGAGVKAGPVLLGLHNLAYLFSSKSIHKGGGYIAIIIRAPNDTGKKYDKTLNCPPGTIR
ncbi:MAG: hypothetical protein ACKVOW_01310 [Chitinophagaceae bacterium]